VTVEHVKRIIAVSIACPQCGARRTTRMPLLDPIPIGPQAVRAASEMLHWAIRWRIAMCACWAEDGNDGSDDGRAPATAFEIVEVFEDDAEASDGAADFLQATPPIVDELD